MYLIKARWWVEGRKISLILLTQQSVMALEAVILQHEVRRPLGRGDKLSLGIDFLTLSDHRKSRQSFESASISCTYPGLNDSSVLLA